MNPQGPPSLFIPQLPPYYDDEPPPTPRPYPPPPTPRSYAPPPSTTDGGVVLFLVGAFALSLFGLFVGGVLKARRNSRERAEAAAAAEAAAPLQRAWPRALPRLEPTRHFEELRLRQARDAVSVAARLPAFKYKRPVKHKVTGGGEEAAACSVCLGVFQLGETVRLLPLCLHLYHVECIDPWLDAHSTCPICRSGTDPTMDAARLPHV